MTPVWREATRGDVADVVALLADDMLGKARETGTPARYLAAFDAMHAEAENRLIVGEADGRIVACYQLIFITGLSLSTTRRAQIEGVRVASDLRGSGLGAALLADAEARAREAGCGLMQLTTNAERIAARRFYEKAGYAASHVGMKKPL